MQEKLVYMRSTSRVVPIEPTLEIRRNILFFGIAMGVTYIVTLLLFQPMNQIIFYADPFFALLWVYSFYPLVYIIRGKPWRTLEKKRQQAARYNLTRGLPTQAAFQRDCTDVPSHFVLRLHRRWLISWLASITRGLEVMVMLLLFYLIWRNTALLLIHQKESIALALVQTVLNVAVVLFYAVFAVVTLVFTPRQQLTATQDGLFCRKGYHFSYIPWQQARLFAVIGEMKTKKHHKVIFYELSSEKAVIRWSSLPTPGRAWDMPSTAVGITRGLAQAACSEKEYQQQIQTLISIVTTKTGLPLYDLR
ncbi:MAG: hypothetical protein WCD86_04295 [Ktedonobacteraceae bacterium]